MLIQNVIAPAYRNDELRRLLREEFRRSEYVRLPGILDPGALAAITDRVRRLRAKSVRRSFVMPGAETPRRMSTLGGKRIVEEEPSLASLYTRDDILSLLRDITGSEIHPCQHEQEFMVANFLNDQGDSHGWHLDDPAFAFVVVLEAPGPEAGGYLEFIPDWARFCRERDASATHDVVPAVAEARRRGLVSVRQHVAGDGYVLRASTALHRVTVVETSRGHRAALNLAYQDVAHQTYGHTATALYAEPQHEGSMRRVEAMRASEPGG